MSFTPSLVSLVDVLREQAIRAPEDRAYTFLPEGEVEGARLTWGELDGRARAIAAVLQERGLGGERILLLFPPGLDFVAAFFGCLYAGAVAVPCYPPRSERNLSRLLSITDDASPRAALTCAAVSPAIPRWQKAAPELERVAWIDVDALPSGAEAAWLQPGIGSGTLAFLQYTSGSTSTPKGVMVSHGNLVHNERLIQHAFRQRESSLVVGWLPLYHDMGLIGNVLQPLWSGASSVLMPPLAFLQKPRRWLEAIHHYRATTSGGPNFAYELCLQKIVPAEREGFDLSSWTVAFNGAEPVRVETQERFAEAFAPCGFRREAFYPCYGLAEATLFVSGGVPGEPAVVRELDAEALAQNRAEAPRPGAPARSLVSCGRAWLGQELAVVDPETGVPCEPGGVGEVWVAGVSVTGGYWNRPEETAAAFAALLPGSAEGPFLRTGDLGFVLDGELYITGRLKDLVILRGRNHYPQDLELTAERSYRALRPGCGAAFSVDVDGEERLVVVQEVERHPGAGVEEMADAIRQAIAEEHEVQVHEVVLARFGAVPKTTSGKVQRRLCRSLYLEDRLPRVGSSVLAEGAAAAGVRAEESTPEGFLRSAFARLAGIDPARIAPDRPLTALGLDSLMAVELKASVEAEYSVPLPLASLLEGASVREIATGLLAGRPAAGDGLPLLRPGAAEAGDLPLSEGQKALWFLERLAPEAGTYNIAVAARALGGLDAEALRCAFESLVLRHSALRSVFPVVGNERGDEPVRRFLERPEIDFRVEDAAGWSEDRLQAELSAEAWRPFDLGRGPLVRVRIFDRSAGGVDPVLLLVVHHIAADFVSFAVAARDLAQGGGPPLRVAYGDFVRWQEEALSGPRGERLWGYWREALAGVPDLDLPTDRPRPPVQTWRGGARTLELPPALVEGARNLAAAHGATPFMVLLAAFQAQLGRISGQDDLAVGTPTAGRSLPELAPLMGYFVNPVALRADLSGELSFAELLGRVRRMAIDGLEHGDFPFARIAERLRPMRDPSRSPLFQTMFLLQGARPGDPEGLATFALGESGGRLSLGDLELESLRIEERRAQLDLTLRVAEEGYGRLRASLEFNTDLFDVATAERMLGHWQTLLAGALADPSRLISLLPLLTPAEREQLLVTWNATVAGAPSGDLLLHQLFEAQAVRAPAAEAVVAGEERLTYQELNARANRLARHLQTLGVGPEVRVGIQLGRGADLVVALLAVLKAGGAYVPLDAKYPQERLELMRADSGARVVIEDVAAIDLTSYDASDLAQSAQPGNLAYLIYTSGSTGRPKAVALEHRSPVALVHWARRVFSDEELSGVLASTSTAFDLSVFEIFVPLSWGGRVILAENALELPRLAAAGEVRLVNTVPSALAELVRSGGLPSSVRTVNLAGEPVPPALADAVCAVPGIERLYNLYGPSEDTTYSAFTRLASGRPVTIGRPLDDTRAYVLDGRLEPVPEGVPGELYLGGAGLARGYLGRPELTAERFRPDPFSEGRLYRTGDLVRWRNAELEFLGRVDHQVKIRGFRIELGEIEAALSRHPAVREAAVLALPERSGDGLRLVAYVSLSGEEPALAAWLRERLPEAFVPTGWVVLPALPLSPNGKVDRKALARIEPAAAAVAGEPPRTPLEATLAGIFAGVLGLERVGIHDDFFALGGHSLLVTRLVSRLNRAFGVDLPVSAVFQAPSVASLAGKLSAMPAAVEAPALEPVPRTGGLPLSFAQQRLWFLHQLEPDSPAYNIPAAVRLDGALAPAGLGRALRGVASRHEALRTIFVTVGDRPVQVVAPEASVPLSQVDLAGLDPARRAGEALHLAEAEAARPFDLEAGPLLRATLLRLTEGEHVLLLAMHHIISDGWSLGIFLRELTAFYVAEDQDLPVLPIQYADYSVWQQSWLTGKALESRIAWWREILAGVPQALDLPTDYPRPAVAGRRGGAQLIPLPAELWHQVESLARRETATPFLVLLAALEALLARYSGAEGFTVGTPVAGRDRLETEGLIGFFVNTLVLRADVAGDPAFRGLLARAREVMLGAQDHQDVPFEHLVAALAPERDLGRTPLFQVMLDFNNAPIPDVTLPGVTISALRISGRTSKFDLSFLWAPAESGSASLELIFRADLFEAATAERILRHLAALLAGAVTDPGARVSDLPLLDEKEMRELLVERNRTAREFPVTGTVHGAFRQQALRTPEAEAVSCDGRSLTFAEVATQAGRLACHLRRLGVRSETRVGLCTERSVETLVGILGILQAGGTWVPLDPSYPGERLAWMLRDSGALVVLTQERVASRLPAETAVRLCLDGPGVLACESFESAASFFSDIGPDYAAYLIYTSGSTGLPKGVVVCHGAVLNLWQALRAAVYRKADPPLRVGLNASLSFDGSVKQLVQVLGGHTLCLIPEEVRRDPAALVEHVRRERLDVLDCTPSQLAALFAEGFSASPEGAPSLILVGGEAVPREVWEAARQLSWTRFVNVYGPTECTVDTTARDFAVASAPAALGRALANVRTYLVDRYGRPVPAGVPGELWIGGAGVARGYLGRPALTAERFVPDPFGGEPGARLYRSGDLTRLLPDGDLEYLGRIDHQVKIRGFRIEPGEIEAVLASHPAVERAVVVVRENGGEPRLVAYMVPEGGEGAGRDALRAHLAGRLPAYLVPSAFVFLPALPLTPSGKVDRRALSAPDAALEEGATDAWIPPRDAVEEVIAGVWADLLGRERVGADDHFFELGGHSLLATRAVARLRASLGVELPLRALFEAPTVVELAVRIEPLRAAGRKPAPPLVPVPRDRDLPLSFAQERLWLLDRLEPESSVYNLAAAVALCGTLRPDVLAAVFREVARRHEALRTTFDIVDGRPCQRITASADIPLPQIDLAGLPDEARRAEAGRLGREEARRPFDLTRGPLLRMSLLQLAPEEHTALVTFHHIASDGWSTGVLVREVAALYQAFAAGRPSPLPELPVQYADFAAWQREWLRGEVLESEIAWWRERLAGAPETLELPADRPRPAVRSLHGGWLPLTFDSVLARGLRALARQRGTTLFSVLLAGFQALLARSTGQTDLLVGVPVANRTRTEVEGLIGFFVNTLVLRAEAGGDPDFNGLLAQVGEAALGAFEHQDLPFDKLVEELRPRRSLARSPLVQVALGLQNAPRPPLELPGLAIAPQEVESGTSRFDLTVLLHESGAGIAGGIEYSADLFDRATVHCLAAHLETLLAGAAARPGARLSELPLLGDAERHQILAEWNATSTAWPRGATVHGLVAEQAHRAPAAPAVEAHGQILTYGELARQAGLLAYRLRRLGVGPESRVGLCLERTADLVTGMLGILEAGAAYVPLDLGYPRERLALMAEDAGIVALVTEERLLPRLPQAAGLPAVCLDGGEGGEGAEERGATEPGVDGLAYVMYTSGSTGRPKGVAVTHRAILRLVLGTDYVHLGPEDRVLQVSNMAFDAATFEVWGALLNGGCVVGIERETALSPRAFEAALRERRITVLFLTTALFQQVAREVPDAFAPVRYVLFGGEACDPGRVRQVVTAGPPRRLLHVYGPTEGTTFTTWHPVEAVPEGAVTVPIGRPIGSSRVVLLDRDLAPVPAGILGELYAGGDGLARGYLGRPDLTAERFVPDPCSDEPGARLYRTGDLVRQRPDGAVEFLGRIDQQVKIRGFRIEPGEVEAALLAHPEVTECAVLARQETEERRLVAYVVASDPDLAAGGLRGFLRESLPEHMVPAAWVFLPSFPLTPNGKVDRRALPAPEAGVPATHEHVAPRNAVEELLAEIWAEVLGRERVGAHDDFFEIGGHSLLAFQLITRIQDDLGVELPLRSLFESPSLAALAERVALEMAIQAGDDLLVQACFEMEGAKA